MANLPPPIVHNRAGLLGTLERPESLRVGSEARIAVRLTTGPVVLVPVDLMEEQDDGSFFLDLTADEVAQLETERSAGGDHRVEVGASEDAFVVPVIAESIEVAKRLVESGRVQIEKSVQTTNEVVNDSLVVEQVDVERVPIDKIIPGPVGNRQEGDTLVVPVLKEVLVVEKRLLLVEEVRITRRRSEQPFSQTVPLRTETVEIKRLDRADLAGREDDSGKEQ